MAVGLRTGIILAAAAVAMLATSVAGAEAASRLCRQLEAQLAAASGGGSARARKYAAAAETQRRHLARARAQQRQAGCGLFGSKGCAALSATIRKMERNLADIERQAGAGGGSTASRARILAAIEANRCRERPRERQRLARQTREPEKREGARLRAAPNEDRAANTVSGPFGSFRTLCVRTCDGYFFPISFSSTADFFGRDQKACEASCPGTEVKLYMHRVPEEDSEDMVSVAGTAYKDLPTAFAYKRADFVRPEGCTCQRPRNFTIIAGEPKPDDEPAPTAAAIPSPRPDPAAATTGEDPEPDDGEKRVRVVGPVFLPDPEGAIDLRAPAPPPVP